MSKLHKKYTNQRAHAKARGIEFLLSFDEWLAVWTDSGKLEYRGRGKNSYVMARHNDVGPYSSDNVSIKTALENASEGNLGKTVSPETRELIAKARRGTVFSPKTLKRMSESGKTKVFSATHRANLSKAARQRYGGA